MDEIDRGKQPSQWALMARDPADLGPLASDPSWTRLAGQPDVAPWTDDFSSVLGVLRLR